ncbi:transglutaminase domain-containing protein [Microcella humidisoli]|uniref:DUF3488 and transglutaminase-like domain-containing protein n=1 Tax=Microcella humidisoli TaxID=2963406 RepID=A0ABY5FWG3_9MICO|nr:transglutaminase domain-containing protein [Microcella humidisoli]UTT62633.1 DUF3488 and transglutaminase-like domain-containing protein [Microcella humidisoli]
MTTATAFTLVAWTVVAVVLWPIYRDPAFVVLAVVSIGLGCALALAGAIARWPAWGTALAVLAAFTVFGVPLAVPSRTVYGVLPEPAGLLDLFAGVALGWRQLITIDLPVGSYQALLVPAFVLLLIGPVLTLTIAVRAVRGELAAIVPLAAFPIAVALGPQQPLLPISTAIALATTLLLWMAVWRRHRRAAAVGAAAAGDSRWLGARALASGVALLLVAGGVGAATVAAVPPTSDRTVLRTNAERPFDPLDEPSPLAAYRASFDPAIADDAALTVTGAPAGARIRLAVLDSYDGTVFAVGSDLVDSESGRFVRIPTRRDLTGVDGDRVTATLTVQRGTGVWLPSIGDFGAISIAGEDAADLRDRFVYNAVTGTAAFVGGVPVGLEYTIDAVLPPRPVESLADAAPGSAAVPAITAIPEALSTWLGDVVAGVEGSGPRLQRALDTLREQGYLSNGVADDEPPSRSGHSVERIEQLVLDRPMIGDAEQYAVAAALIARELGFPSRVVLGFGPIDESGTTTFVERDRTAWVEVSTAGSGWVAVDVVPERREIPPTEPDEPVPVARPQNAVPPPVDDPPPLEELAPPEIEQLDDPAIDPFWQAVLAVLSVVGPVLLIAGLIASPLMGIAAAKLRRRRRRRTASDPAARILGGWRDVTDEAIDFGVALPQSATRSEVAAVIGRPQAMVLARVADRAVYAPEAPESAEAERVWATADAVRASLAEGRTRRERWRAAISPRSLRRYPERRRTTGGRAS